MSKEHDKYRALHMLSEHIAPKDIADSLDMSYAGVLKLKKEYENARETDSLKDLLNYPEAVLDEILDIAKAKSPVPVDDEVDLVKQGVQGAQMLQEDLQRTALYMSQRIRSLAGSTESTGEFCDLTESLCKLQTAFFNSNTTQVNIQNNVSSEGTQQKYGGLLDDRPPHL